MSWHILNMDLKIHALMNNSYTKPPKAQNSSLLSLLADLLTFHSPIIKLGSDSDNISMLCPPPVGNWDQISVPMVICGYISS